MQKVLWTASLSNGETIYEGKGNFQVIEGALSPWQRLLSYLVDAKVEITSLSLYTNDGKRWTLPSAGKNPKFAELTASPKPFDYRMFRKAAAEGNSAGITQEFYTVIEAAFLDGRALQIWVSEDGVSSWSIII